MNQVIDSLMVAKDLLSRPLRKNASIHLPYCWHDVPGTTEMILLNRSYKPVGNNTGVKHGSIMQTSPNSWPRVQ